MIPKFSLVVAMDEKRGIGREGLMPWRLPGDMAYFKRLTLGIRLLKQMNTVVMGRKTWESIPPKFRPLEGRKNMVVTRAAQDWNEYGALAFSSLTAALNWVGDFQHDGHTFVIGGGQIYEQAITLPQCRSLYVTRIRTEFECDTFFPEYEEDFEKIDVIGRSSDNGFAYVFEEWQRKQ